MALISVNNLTFSYNGSYNNDSDYSPVTATTPESNHIEVTRMEETISTRQLALKTIENIELENKQRFKQRHF